MSTGKYVEMTAAIAIDRPLASRLDLLVGIHPEKRYWLTEDEELRQACNLLRFVSYDEILKGEQKYKRCEGALLWLKHFPELKEMSSGDMDRIAETLWALTLKEADVLHLAYSFYPANGVTNHVQRKTIRKASQALQQEIDHLVACDSRAQARVTWTFPFPAEGPLGQAMEQKAGLSYDLKARLGLTRHAPGLLCNFLLTRGRSLAEILDPYQFEELIGVIYAQEGWQNIELTPKSRDGGKDVIAKRITSGTTTVAYIQVKKNTESHKVGITEVKEFVATVAADKVDMGYIVTTSYFSRPATRWLQEKGGSLALVELVNRETLLSKMQRIADSSIAIYLKI